jgi:hypothetical protein
MAVLRLVAASVLATSVMALSGLNPGIRDRSALSDASRTTVVVFNDVSRPMGSQGLALTKALEAVFRERVSLSNVQVGTDGEVTEAGGGCEAGIRVLLADCRQFPSFRKEYALLTLPAIRVFPASVRGAFPMTVPFAPNASLPFYTNEVLQIHEASCDVHRDGVELVNGVAAISHQSQRLATVAGNTTLARQVLSGLADKVAEQVEAEAARLRARAARLDVLKLLAQSAAQHADETQYGLFLSDLSQTLTSSGTDLAADNQEHRLRLLQRISVLSDLTRAMGLINEDDSAALGKMLDDLVQ